MRPDKDEVMRFLKPEPATEQEIAGLIELMPGDYEIYRERLTMILAECKEVFIRTGVSHMLHAGDLIVGLHTAHGDLVHACLGTFIHSVTAQNPIKWIMRNFRDNPSVGVRDGDIFYCNEATYGGIHNCDQLAFMPIFHEGELIAWASAGTHIFETGGITPGGMIATARSRYDEGMSLSPIKIAENYQLRDDLLEMMVNFISRAPRQQTLDLKARVAAADRLRTRIQELATRKGNGFVLGLLRKMINVAEQGARHKILKWNDGTYRNVCFVGSVGVRSGLWRLFCTAYKKGDHILFDYTGTSPENDSSWNCMPWVAICYAALYMYSHCFHDLPVSVGTLAPLDFRIPDSTAINPNWDAAVSNAPLVGQYLNELLPKLFASMMFRSEDDRLEVSAPMSGMVGGGAQLSGVNQWGVAYVSGSSWTMNTLGQGARTDMDGMDSAVFPSGVHAYGSDAEEVEIDRPTLHFWQNHRKDSCGHGRYRGGASGCTGTVVYGVAYVKTGTVTGSQRGRIPIGQGLFGGYPSYPVPGIIINKSNILELMARGEKELPTSLRLAFQESVTESDEPLQKGLLYDGSITIGVGSGGGYGYGDVLEREPQAVVNDVRDEIISAWAARNVYHVLYDAETWTADEEKTKELRRREHEDRLRRAKSYGEFEKEWLKKKPPEEQLAYYGSWPDAKIIRPIIRI